MRSLAKPKKFSGQFAIWKVYFELHDQPDSPRCVEVGAYTEAQAWEAAHLALPDEVREELRSHPYGPRYDCVVRFDHIPTFNAAI
jgi:hypothetical protein